MAASHGSHTSSNDHFSGGLWTCTPHEVGD
jgi:hypothetical protein